jgi:hypothetical protein
MLAAAAGGGGRDRRLSDLGRNPLVESMSV